MENNMQENVYGQDEPKRKNIGLIVGIVVAVVAVIAIVSAVVTFLVIGESAEKKANKAFSEMSKEFAEYTTSIVDDIGFEKLGDYAKENTMHAYLDLSMTLPESDSLGNVGFTLDGISDIKNNAWKADVEVGAYGFSLNIGSITYDNQDLYVQSRFLGSDTYKVALANFTEDFNNSVWSDILGTEIPEDAIDTYAGLETVDYSEYKDLVYDLWKEAKENVKYSSIKGKKEFEVAGDTIKCTGIEITVDKDYINASISDAIDALMESYINNMDSLSNYSTDDFDVDEFNEDISVLKSIGVTSDVVFDIYLDSKGCIVNMSTPADIEFANDSEEKLIEAVSFDLNFSGSERRADVISGDVYIKADGKIACINVDREAYVSDDEYDENIIINVSSDSSEDVYTVSYANTWDKQNRSFDMTIATKENNEETFALSMNGDFEDIVTGESYTLNLKNAKLSVEGENALIVSGQYTYEPSKDSIEVPQDSVNFFDMTKTEAESMIYGVLGNVISVISGSN
jgi:hypothetical protein